MKKRFNLFGTAFYAILYTVWFLGAMPAPGYAAELATPGMATAQTTTVVSLAPTEQSTEESTVSSKTLKKQVEQAKEKATTKAESLVDREAIAAVEETKNAIASIQAGNTQEAIQAMERATGKLDILLAREPELALIPISSTVEIIDVAPSDELTLKDFRNRIKNAINAGDFPEARELLNNLMSEVQTKTLNLPLATYPEAMKEAARLLDEGNTEVAKDVLQIALSTLVVTEEAQSIPLINAQTKLMGAAAVAGLDREDAFRLLANARQDLQLAKDLGYASGDREYAELDKAIKDIEQKLKSDIETSTAFAQLQDKLSNFLKRIS